MLIEKVLNNNVVITRNSDGKETIAMGRGLGFQKKMGMKLDQSKIEKTFSIDSGNRLASKYTELIQVSAVVRWKRQYKVEKKAITPEQQQIQELEKQLARAKRDIDILKKRAPCSSKTVKS